MSAEPRDICERLEDLAHTWNQAPIGRTFAEAAATIRRLRGEERIEGTVSCQSIEDHHNDCMVCFYTQPTDGWGSMRPATLVLHPTPGGD